MPRTTSLRPHVASPQRLAPPLRSALVDPPGTSPRGLLGRPAPLASSLRLGRAAGWISAVALGALLFPATAEARPDRRGFQSDFTLGVAGCMPYRAQCTSSDVIAGRTGPSLGLGVTLGLRPIKPLLVGASYNFGMFNPKYAVADADYYKVAYQNSFFAVVRPILPIWRFDFGLELGAGWSKQVFRTEPGQAVLRQGSQGFALKVAPVIDFFVTKHFFLGAKADFIFNFHGDVCTETDDGKTVCQKSDSTNQASVHQVIAGFHLGTVF
ncbi:MAG: hypothetical protein R3B09_19925 [Nannocystaceae bacterium]